MRTLGVLAKEPTAGQVKTRLGQSVGAEWAAKLYEAFLLDVLERFQHLADRRVIAFCPNETPAREYFERLCGAKYLLWPQPSGSLGDRMQRFFEEFLRSGEDRVVIVTSDSATLPAEVVRRAFEELAAHECVLGPAVDGGYYLLGLRGRVWSVFDGVQWSTSAVLGQTVDHVERLGLRLALLDPWYDVDTEQDLDFLRSHLRALRAAGSSLRSSATEAFLGI